MQQQGKNVFIGLDQDLSKASPDRNQKYWTAQNVSILLNEEGSNLTLTNEKGNKKILDLPYIHIRAIPDSIAKWDQPGTSDIIFTNDTTEGLPTHVGKIATTYQSGSSFPSTPNTLQYSYYNLAEPVIDGVTVIPPTQWSIIGSITLRDDIILYTVYEKSPTTPSKNPCAIWKLNYGKDFQTSVELLYLGPLKFSKSNLIKGIPSHENNVVSKVYWEDGKLNYFRHLNIEKDNFLFTAPTNINHVPDVSLTQPSVTSTTTGGNIKAGLVQYFYVLYNAHGESSNPSPYSDQYPVVLDNSGVAVGSTGTTVFVVECDNLDNRFDSIRLYRVHYTSATNTPDIYLISDSALNTNQTKFKFMDSGVKTELAIISQSEFLNLTKTPFKPNTISSINNRSIIANIEEGSFDVDFDTRAYRFKVSNNYMELLDSNNNPTGYTISSDSDFNNLSSTLDAVCPFNKAQAGSNVNWEQFQYQRNSTTVGATGVNVEISFTTEILSNTNYFTNVLNFKKRSYKRDEIYRLGVVFINKKGQRSYAKWITDLRMPSMKLNASYSHATTSGLTGLYPVVKLKNLNSLPDDVVGYQIVRLDRTESDRTVLSQGLFNSVIYDGITGDADAQIFRPDIIPRRHTTTFGGMIGLSPINYSNSLGNGIDMSSVARTDGINEVNKGTGKYSIRSDFFTFYSPEIEYAGLKTLSETVDNFQILGGLSLAGTNAIAFTKQYTVTDDGDISSSQQTDTDIITTGIKQSYRATPGMGMEANTKVFGIRPDILSPKSSPNYSVANFFPLTNSMFIFESGEKAKIADSQNITFENVIKVEGSEDDKKTYKTRKRKYLEATSPRLLVGRISFGGSTLTSKLSGVVSDTLTTPMLGNYILGDWKRILVNQYGGDSYEQRSYSGYIPCGDYQIITSTNHTQTIYNGDIFVQYYKYFHSNYKNLSLLQHYDNVTVDADDNEQNLTNQGNTKSFSNVTSKFFVEIPIETTIALDLKPNKKQEQSSDFETTPSSWWDYNDAYHRPPNVDIFPAKPFSYTEVSNFDNMFRYSQVKTSNELLDSYLNFYANDYKEVARENGEVTGLYQMNNSVFATLERGVGAWNVDPTAQVVTSSGVVNLGNGAFLNNFVLLSTTNGTTHRTGAIASKSNLYVVDTRANKILTISQPQLALSDTMGIHSILKDRIGTSNMADKPILGNGVVCGYDPFRNNVFFTFSIGEDSILPLLGGGFSLGTNVLDNFTLSYNELTNSFVSFHSFVPSLYFNNSRYMFMCKNGASNNTVWVYGFGDYGTYFGVVYGSNITLISNNNPDINKMFYNIYYRIEGYDGTNNDETVNFSTYKAWTDNQSTGIVTLNSKRDLDKHLRYWRFGLDRNLKGSTDRERKERLTNTWLFLQLNYDNTSNKNFRLHNVITNYNLASY